jgi:peptidyl-prolyl cis-trans isomerase C
MSMRVKITLFAALAAALVALPHNLSAKETPADAAAIVNGSKILRSDVSAAIKTIPNANPDEMYPRVVDGMINEKLIDDETTKAQITSDPEYKKRLDMAKAEIARQLYIDKYMKDKVTDSAVAAEYAKFKKENEGKQEVHARHILVPTEEEAKQVIKDLDGGAKFEDLAKKRSSGPTAQNGGDLGYFTKEDMLPEFSDAAFKLDKGQYTKAPVKTQFGWHVILVEDKRARQVPELKSVEGAIRNSLSRQAIAELVERLRSKATIQIFDKDGKPVEAPKKG